MTVIKATTTAPSAARRSIVRSKIADSFVITFMNSSLALFFPHPGIEYHKSLILIANLIYGLMSVT
jgi:hypothetical protein